MKPSVLADRLEVNSDTIRRWAATYRKFLSPSANPSKGKTRSFTDEDARILLLIATLRDSGVDHSDIEDRLTEHQADNWRRLPEIPPEWELDDETVPLGVAVSKASDLAQIAVLRNELENTRNALMAAEDRINELEKELTAERSEKDTAIDELTQIKLTAEQLRGQVKALEARIQGYNIAYGFGRDRPISIAVIIGITAVVVALLIVAAVVIGSII